VHDIGCLFEKSINQEKLKAEVIKILDNTNPLLITVCDSICECAEIALQEYKSERYRKNF
jgi:hypothetical protein